MEQNKVKYVVTNKNKSILLKVNYDALDFDICERASLDIDYSWFIEEDGSLEYAGNVYEVKAGDSILMLYTCTEESKILPYNKQVRELVIIEGDSTFGKLINKKRDTMLEERRSDKNSPNIIGECAN